MKTMESLLAQAIKLNKEMQELKGDEYYAAQERLRVMLCEIESGDFILLPKIKLVKFLSLCSTHRPVPPHSLLTRISIQRERLLP